MICFSQNEQKTYPFAFDQIHHSYSLLNPTALKANDFSFSSILGFNDFNSLSKDVYTMYIKADLSFSVKNHFLKARSKPKDKKPFHKLSLSLFPEKEGIYINKTRSYLGYSYALPINEKITASLGVQLGYINYAIHIPGGSSGGAPDASVGLGLFTDDFSIGISANQVLNSSLTLFVNPIKFSRFYTLMAEKSFTIHPLWKLKSSVFSTLNTPFSDLTFSNLFYYNNSFCMGSSLRIKYGVMAIVGIENIELRDLLLLFSTSYRVNIGQEQVINTNRVELTLGVNF